MINGDVAAVEGDDGDIVEGGDGVSGGSFDGKRDAGLSEVAEDDDGDVACVFVITGGSNGPKYK